MKNLIKVSVAAVFLCVGGVSFADDATHTMHDKQMKNDRGVKDGEPMSNAPSAVPAAPTSEVTGPTHTTHDKQMKSTQGVKEGEPMKDPAAPLPAAASTKAAVSTKDTHTTHNKQMKSTQGVKEGEPMPNAPAQ